jgi:hypothetical protein
MTDKRKPKDPTRWATIIIVVVVSLVIIMLLYNAISQKRAYDESQGGVSAPAAAPAVAASGGS